jgi:phage terminase large subunit-like protein
VSWEAYASGTEVDAFADFCREFLVQSEDRWAGEPLVLEDFQVRMMGEALAVGDDDAQVWQSVVIVMPRKNGKTALLAAYAIYRLFDDGNPEILFAASSDKQAGKLFSYAANYVRRNPRLVEVLRVRDHEGEIVREDGLGKILRMSSDAKRLHGYNPTIVVADELAQWTTPQLARAYAALTSGGGARTAPQVFTITTAGEAHERHDSILGRLLDGAFGRGEVEERPGLRIARDHEARRLVWNYEAPTMDPYDTKALKLANPAPWITEEFLAKQAANDELTDSQVLQLHGCVWAERSDSWFPAGVWDRLVLNRTVEPDTRIVMGFDGSERRDSTALVGVTLEERPHVFVIEVWERPENATGWKVPRAEVKEKIAWAMRQYEVVEFPGDPPGWASEREEWEELYGSPPVIDFNTRNISLMAPACARFRSAGLEGEFTHDGDPRLAKHVANAVTKESRAGTYITKDHPDSPLKIDLAVAAVMAYSRATSDDLATVYGLRGLVTV